MKYTIEKMSMAHIDDVTKLEKICFPEDAWTKTMFKGEICNDATHYIVCTVDDKIVGYGGFWYTLDGADITNVAVHPDFRRMGLGEKILKYMIDLASKLGADKMMLEVRKSNEAARALYEKNGFESISIRKRYYADNGEDAVIMIKEW